MIPAIPRVRDGVPESRVIKWFAKLKKFEPKWVDDDKDNAQLDNAHLGVPDEWFSNAQLLTLASTVYNEMDRITDYFTEDERMKARRKDAKSGEWHPAPAVLWATEGSFREHVAAHAEEIRAARSAGAPSNHPNSPEREALWGALRGYEVTGFKQSLAVAILRKLGSRRVLDISAGWGDRLVAALAVGAEYVGADPNRMLERGHTEIIQTLGQFVARGGGGARVLYHGFESAEVQAHLAGEPLFDTVFTSPPYFDFEKYTDDASQSMAAHLDWESWFREWLSKVLRLAWGRLRSGGHMAIHMSHKQTTTPMLDFMAKWLPGAKYQGVLACNERYDDGKTSLARPTWVFRKMGEACAFSAAADGGPVLLPGDESEIPAFFAKLATKFQMKPNQGYSLYGGPDPARDDHEYLGTVSLDLERKMRYKFQEKSPKVVHSVWRTMQ